MQYLSFSLWIISLSMLPSQFFHGIANMTSSNKHGLVYFTTWITVNSSLYYPFFSQIESYLDLTEYLYSKMILFGTRFRYFCFGIIALYVLFPEKAMATHSSTLAWKIHGWRSLVGCSPWGREESDTTERLHFHFSLSCIGEGNGYPLQCSCLENPRDGRAWWAAIYGVSQSWTRLKWLSSSSSMCYFMMNLKL